jgi:hypothetical protein
LLPSYLLVLRQCLKALAGAAGTGIVITEPFLPLFCAMDNVHAALHRGLRRVAAPSFARRFKSRVPRRSGRRCLDAWCAFFLFVLLFTRADFIGVLRRAIPQSLHLR